MSRKQKQFAMLHIVLPMLILTGCETASDLAQDIDGSREATFWFWGRLQGIQYRGNEEITSLNQSNLAAAQNSDVDATAAGFAKLSTKHTQLADQLSRLDIKNVDDVAVDYRDRLIARHREVSAEFTKVADATKSRNLTELETHKEQLRERLTDYRDLSEERKAVMQKLEETFGGDFNVME